MSTHPELTMSCPVDGCSMTANAYIPLFATPPDFNRQYLAACTDAAIDAIAHHVAEDHIGHSASCPRRADRNDYCDCNVYASCA